MIYICDLDDEHLEVHKRELASLYPEVEVHTRAFDAAEELSVEAVVGDALERYGRLDVMFANAGVAAGKTFTETTDEEFMRMMRTNVLR